MELTIVKQQAPTLLSTSNFTSFDIIDNSTSLFSLEKESTNIPFILSNTIPMNLHEIRDQHIIPVFVKDNEPVISHHDFIDATMDIVGHFYKNETILKPSIRVSHPIKGRIPEAKNKSAKELFENEKTIYYERMAFVIEIPTIQDTVEGNTLSLTIGGVKAYNLDNLYNKKGTDEHFKIFIGFQNKVCCNLCVWSDGYVSDLKVKNYSDLMKGIYDMIFCYKAEQHLRSLKKFLNYSLTEHEFATLIGRSRLYQYLTPQEKKIIPKLSYGDTQLGVIAKDYYQDQSFCKQLDGDINLWRVYNLFTGANKQSYIDTFLNRSVNAFDFVEELAQSIENKSTNWFLS